MTRQVVITGIGLVTPLGVGLAENLRALGAPRPQVPASSHAGEVSGLRAREFFSQPKALKMASRPAQFAVAAAVLALRQARWSPSADERERLGVILGTTTSDLRADLLCPAVAGLTSADTGDARRLGASLLDGLNPLWLLDTSPNMPSAHVAIQLELKGPNSTATAGWGAGLQALGDAADCIAGGEAEAVLAGGTDSALHPFVGAAWQKAGLSTHEGGATPGEGAAVFLLEDAELAAARGVEPLASWRGYGSAPVRADTSAARVDAAREAAARTLRDAGWAPRDPGRVIAVDPAWPDGTRPCRAALDGTGRGVTPGGPSDDADRRAGRAGAATAPVRLAFALGARVPAGRRQRVMCLVSSPCGPSVGVAVETWEPSPGDEP